MQIRMKARAGGSRAIRRGFTLIELLTVIAIIAILAALLFPVMAAVRKSAQKTSCISNLHAIVQGLEMYKDDWRVYPEVLYGFAAPDSNNDGNCPVNPAAGTVFSRLFPSYVKDEKVFTCPNSPAKQDPQKYLSSNIPLTTTATNMMTGQPQTRFNPLTNQNEPYCFWIWDSYDFQYNPMVLQTGAHELHYSRKWTTVQPGVTDDPRQLYYREPPDSTVVTYCMYHAELDSTGKPGQGAMALVAFKSGRVQTIPVEQLPAWTTTGGPWQTFPKP